MGARTPQTDFARRNATPGLLRLRNADGEFLHLSGTGTTPREIHAWCGTKQQARTLRDRTLAQGKPWPFTAIGRQDQ